MKSVESIARKIHTLESLKRQLHSWKVTGKKIAFTNGVFDILHTGHLQSITEAALEAHFLVVAINSDASVKRLKGNDRPVNKEMDRAMLIASMMPVDAVIIFEEDTPLEVIKSILPDVLVKGGDYTKEQIVGAREVEEAGGRVVINAIKEGYSTTGTIARMKLIL